MEHPDPKWHKRISFLKSALRIFAGGAFIYGAIASGGTLLVIAEILGIVEEIV